MKKELKHLTKVDYKVNDLIWAKGLTPLVFAGPPDQCLPAGRARHGKSSFDVCVQPGAGRLLRVTDVGI